MKKITFILLIFIASCSENKTADEGIYFQDFDNLRMWSRNYAVSSERAHSGNFSAFTDANNEFSQTFIMDYSYAKNKGYRAMQITAWVLAPETGIKGAVVASVGSSQGSHAYAAADLIDVIKDKEKWERLNLFLKLPENAPADAEIKCYLWSPSKSLIYLDDIEIKLHK